MIVVLHSLYLSREHRSNLCGGLLPWKERDGTSVSLGSFAKYFTLLVTNNYPPAKFKIALDYYSGTIEFMIKIHLHFTGEKMYLYLRVMYIK